MAQKLWEKSVQVNKDIERFTVGRDREMDLYLAKHDVVGSMAHITMLESIGLLTKEELALLLEELKNIYAAAEKGEFVIEEGVEDVHSQVELMLTRKLGDIGKKIHSGRSRNDQVLLDLKLFTRAQIKEIAGAVEQLFHVLIRQSERFKDVLMPGYTHLQIAMPSSFGLWFGAYVMCVQNKELGADGVFVMGDCGLNQNPNPEQLADIAASSAESFEYLVGEKARVAMLSHSTHGSAAHPDVDKVVEATKIAQKEYPQFLIDGELQTDAAVVPEVAALKAPDSPVAGKANVLIFPDLDAGNIGYKLIQRLGNAEAYGPLCQGIAKPVNDLSRGCSAKDIVGVVAITAVQAQIN